MSECFYKDGLSFSCQRCSHCCRDESGYVYLSRQDFDRLCACFGMDPAEFVETYCRFVPFYDGSEVLCLKERENYDCVLWENGCKAYGARPVQCSTYPFWSSVLASKKSWEREAKECPGINKGERKEYNEIERRKNLYEENFPLRKGEVF